MYSAQKNHADCSSQGVSIGFIFTTRDNSDGDSCRPVSSIFPEHTVKRLQSGSHHLSFRGLRNSNFHAYDTSLSINTVGKPT